MTGASLLPWFGQDRALSLLDAGVAASEAEHVSIFLSARAGHHTRFAGQRVHQAQTMIECQAMVRCVVGTGNARVAVSDPNRIVDAVRSATWLARQRDGDGHAEPAAVASAAMLSVLGAPTTLWFEATADFDEGARSKLAGAIMAAAGSVGASASGVLTAAMTELAVATSEGVRLHAAATEAAFAVTASAGEASSFAADIGRDITDLDVRDRAERAVSEAKRMAPLERVPDGVHDVVFGGLATGELIGFVPAVGFTGPAVLAGIGPLAGTDAAELAGHDVTIADDALSETGLPFPFDLEGVPKRRVALVDEGWSHGAVSDLASAAATGGRSTGHAHIARESSPAPVAANLQMRPGSSSEEELIAGVERGLYVQRLWYNRLADPKTATVIGTSRDGCFLIEDGRRTRGLSSARFTESVLCALRRTDGIGDTLVSQPVPNVWNGCVSAPAIRVRGFRFGPRPVNGVKG